MASARFWKASFFAATGWRTHRPASAGRYFALMAFGQLFGFVGVLIALPTSAIISVVVRHLRSHYLASSFYNTQT